MEKKTLSASAEQSSASPQDPAAPPAASLAPGAVAPAFDNTIHVEGILDIDVTKGGNGQLLDMSKTGKRRPTDTFVPKELIRRFKLKAGSLIGGTAFPPEGRFPNPKMRFIETVDGLSIEERRAQLEAGGLAPWRVELLLALDECNRSDLYATPTDAVRQLTGHPPRTVEDYIERNRTAFS